MIRLFILGVIIAGSVFIFENSTDQLENWEDKINDITDIIGR